MSRIRYIIVTRTQRYIRVFRFRIFTKDTKSKANPEKKNRSSSLYRYKSNVYNLMRAIGRMQFNLINVILIARARA